MISIRKVIPAESKTHLGYEPLFRNLSIREESRDFSNVGDFVLQHLLKVIREVPWVNSFVNQHLIDKPELESACEPVARFGTR